MAQLQSADNLIAFPRADLRHLLGAAVKRHRLPEDMGQSLVREAANFANVSTHTALSCALALRMNHEPIDFEKARGILLVGPAGAGKSTVAAKIAHAAALIGRKVELSRADGGLALFRTRTNPPELLTVMEADGFNPVNSRAASAFSALGDIGGVETIGVISAMTDAEDAGDIVTNFRFRRVIITNLDRTRRLGASLAAALSGARLAHATYGSRPEDGLQTLEAGALAAQMLEITPH